MSRTLAGVLAGLFLLAFAFVAVAGVPDPDNSSVDLSGGGGGMSTCPALDGEPFESMQITALRADYSPIQGIPYNSFFFIATGADLNFSHVTAETDVNGDIWFDIDDNESFVGDVTIEVQIYTVVLSDSDVLACNSYDIDQDEGSRGCVNAVDFARFLACYGETTPPCVPSCDFNWDGIVGAQDFALWLSHYGHCS
jgi:hypothetical protein